MCEFIEIINEYLTLEFIHRHNKDHVSHNCEVTQTQFMSWEPLHEPLTITIKCARPHDLSEDEQVASHVFKKLYLEPLLLSYSSSMLGGPISKNFDKESTMWRFFEGRVHFHK
jgi:hypothetical protein